MNHIAAGPRLHTESIGPDDTPTTTLFRALSRADVDHPPPDVVLNDFVDPDALDDLFDGGRPRGAFGAVTFEAWGILVAVSAEEVSLYEALSPSVAERRPARPARPDEATAGVTDERERP